MTVEEVFVFVQAVVVTDFHQGLMGVALSKLAETGPGQPIQGPPQDLVVQTPDVKADPAGAGLGPDDVDGLGGQGGSGLDVGGLEPCWPKLLSHDDQKLYLAKDVTKPKKKEVKTEKKVKILSYVGSSLGKSLHG